MSLHNFHELLRRGTVAGGSSGQDCFAAAEGLTLHFGTSAPSGAGYAPGCIFQNTLTGVVYYNSGSKTACVWAAIGSGSTSIIDNGAALNDGGANDAILTLTTQTVGSPALTIPDFANVDDTFAFCTLAQTLASKTLDASNSWFVKTGGTDRGVKFDCSAIAGAFFTTFAVGNPLADRILTLPITATTLVGHDTANTLTNKTIDCDGAGNVITNVNANELDPITPGAATYAVPFVLAIEFTNLPAAGTDIFTDNAPFAFRVIDCYTVATSGDGGTFTLNKGKVGAVGTAITNTITIGADKALVRCTTIDNAQHEIAAGGSLVMIGDAGTADGIAYITCIRTN